jgi:hypothetical protein
MSNNNYWSADSIARRAQQAHQRVVAEQAAQEQEQQQSFMDTVGRTMINIVNGYTSHMRPATTSKVAGDFYRAFPQAGPREFKQTLETLKAEGVLCEIKGAEGFMGERDGHLFAL